MNKEQKQAFEGYLREVKIKLKQHSKNELIRVVGALLLDKQIMNEEIKRKMIRKYFEKFPNWSIVFFIIGGIVIGLLNTLVKPLMKILSLPFIM